MEVQSVSISYSISLLCMILYDTESGNPEDPDLSNPARYRFESPLETIRSFEAVAAENLPYFERYPAMRCSQ